MGQTIRVGIDVACRADHQASCTDATAQRLDGVRCFTGLVPKIDQSGLAGRHQGVTNAGDPAGCGRRCSWPPTGPARFDPTLAGRYHRFVADEGRHHTSAVCTVGAVPSPASPPARGGASAMSHATSTAPRSGGGGRQIGAERSKVTAEVRAAHRRASGAQQLKRRYRGGAVA